MSLVLYITDKSNIGRTSIIIINHNPSLSYWSIFKNTDYVLSAENQKNNQQLIYKYKRLFESSVNKYVLGES